MKIQLGDRVRDRITGITGIAIGRTEWLYGCIRVTVQPEKLKDGKPGDTLHYDEPQLELVKAGVVQAGNRDTGGPAPVPQRREGVQR